MEKLTKTFQSGEVLMAQDLNNISSKVNELVEDASTGGSITVDSSLSKTSTNPVQNKVITTELNKKVNSESGKGLSENNYTTTDKNKLNGLKNHEDDIKTINERVETLSALSIPKLSLRNENMSGEFEYSNDGGVITQPIYTKAVRITDLPQVANESKSVVFSNEVLGSGIYFIINNASISDSNGIITSSYLDKYRFEVQSLNDTSSVKVTALEATSSILSAIVQVSYLKLNATKATIILNCDSQEDANNITLTIPHTKFDKQPFSVTLDDANTSHFCVTHLGINNRVISPGGNGFMHANQYKAGDIPTSAESPLGYPLCFTDGCGNDRRFAVGCAVWPNSAQGDNAMMDSVSPIDPTATNQYRFMSPYLQWEDVKEMLKWGHSISQHNVSYSDPTFIKQGFAEDCAKSIARVGRGLKMMTQPDGNSDYTTAFESYDSLLMDVSERYQPVKPFTDSFSLYKAKCFRKFPDPASGYLAEISNVMAMDKSERPWIHLGQHRTVKTFVTDFLVPVYQLYGKAGSDNIWFASPDEVYEYWYMRKHAQIKKTVSGTKVTFDIYFPKGEYFYYPELTFMPSLSNFTVYSLSDTIIGFSINTTKDMFNINLSKKLLEMSEECVSKYESTSDSTDRDDAVYFVSQLKPGTVKEAFNTRINAVSTPILITGITISDKPSTITDSAQLSVVFTPSDTTQRGVNWSSSDPSVATVDTTGEVTAIKAGSVTITATSSVNSSISDSLIVNCHITQTTIPVTGLTISGPDRVDVGEHLQLSVSYVPTNTTQTGINWSSSDPSVATVDTTGEVTAIKAGSVTITATSSVNSSISTTQPIVINAVSVGNATCMIASYSWGEYKVDHMLDPTSNKYLTVLNENNTAGVQVKNLYDCNSGEVIPGWIYMTNDEKKSYYGISALENWLDAASYNVANPDYSPLLNYKYSFKYNGSVYPILGWNVSNGNYKVSILSFTSKDYNLKDGHLEINKVEQEMPDLSLQNNRQWAEFPPFDVTDGKIVLRMWGNTSKNVGLNIIKIEKIS